VISSVPRWITGVVPRSQGRAVDLGCGDGDLAAWLGARGYTCFAFDLVPPRRRAAKVRFLRRNVLDVDLAAIGPHVVVARSVLPFFVPSVRRKLLRRIARSLAPGGIFCAEVFTVEDPACREGRELGVPTVARNTYRVTEAGGVASFFEANELLEDTLATRLHVVHYFEGLVRDHDEVRGHHVHGVATIVARKAA
jgi:SAM-dependent methyltransferase